jgi:hypothetical protein
METEEDGTSHYLQHRHNFLKPVFHVDVDGNYFTTGEPYVTIQMTNK